MASRVATVREPRIELWARGTLPTVAWTAGTLVVATTASALIAVANQPYFDLVERLFGHVDGEIARGLVFSSFLLVLGIPVVIRAPATFGLQVGSLWRERWLVLVVVAAASALTWLALQVAGAVPYRQASLFIESVDVPVTEELVFRGVLLTALLAVLGRWHGPRATVALAVAFDAIAFGVAHSANALALDPGFVAQQVAFALVLGAGCAALMVRTRSVYSAMLFHGAVNAVVVLA